MTAQECRRRPCSRNFVTSLGATTMKVDQWVRALPVIAAGLLSACGNLGGSGMPSRTGAPPPSYARPGATIYPDKVYGNTDAYKVEVARHIVQSNLEGTFEGQLPPILPAIVVLRVSVDRDGMLREVFVQRSRDDHASAVALAAIHRAGMLPKPGSLIPGAQDALEFSETFLFNHDYRFQIRSLAGPQ
jgi:protein TonB